MPDTKIEIPEYECRECEEEFTVVKNYSTFAEIYLTFQEDVVFCPFCGCRLPEG